MFTASASSFSQAETIPLDHAARGKTFFFAKKNNQNSKVPHSANKGCEQSQPMLSTVMQIFVEPV
jgi:hypothetical protein